MSKKKKFLCQKGYCKVWERKIKPCFEFESISVLLLRESGGGTCQRVEEEEEIQRPSNNAQARTAMELLGPWMWPSETAPIVKMAALLPPLRLPSLYRLARLPRGEPSQLTSLARNGYIQSHTVSSTLTPNIFKLLPHFSSFSWRDVRHCGFSLLSLTPDVYSPPKSSSSFLVVVDFPRKDTHENVSSSSSSLSRRAFTNAHTAQRCLTPGDREIEYRRGEWRQGRVKDTCKRGSLKNNAFVFTAVF